MKSMKKHRNVKQKFSFSILIFLSLLICNIFAQTTEQSIETVIQTGHYAAVTAVAYSPDGKFAATGSADKTIKLWEVATGREIRSYLGNSGDITFLTFNQNGKYLQTFTQGYYHAKEF